MSEGNALYADAFLTNVPPASATALLRDRLRKASAVNDEVAEWFRERAMIEETYAKSLSKLAAKPLPNIDALGVFGSAWVQVAGAAEGNAKAHHRLARKLDETIGHPLRDYSDRDPQWSEIKRMEQTLTACIRDIEAAESSLAKASKKKKSNGKAADAQSQVVQARQAWESTAPMALEKFQAVDAARLANIQNLLVQYQTLEAEVAQETMRLTESVTNVVLSIDAEDEITAFAAKQGFGSGASGAMPRQGVARGQSFDDGSSMHSTGSSSKGGLKSRFGTMLRGKKSLNFSGSTSPKKPATPTTTRRELYFPPEQRPSTGSSQGYARPPTTGTPTIEEAREGESTPPQFIDNSPAPPLAPVSVPAPVQTYLTPPSFPQDAPRALEEPLQARVDAEGYSVAPPAPTLISDTIAEEETDSFAELQPAIQVQISQNAIRSENAGEDTAALSKVTSALRAQPTVSRRGGRGRREVRNTMFVPGPSLSPDLTGGSVTSGALPSPGIHGRMISDDQQSIRSSRSAGSSAPGTAATRHPELTGPGLNASIIETVSARMQQGKPTNVNVLGEIALAYSGKEQRVTINLDQFQTLEKVAPNPAFMEDIADKPGEYHVALTPIQSRATIALKYQAHVDEANMSTFLPIIVTPMWKHQEGQSLLIVTYKANPTFRRMGNAVRVQDLVLFAGVEGVQASSCDCKPPIAAFSTERQLAAMKVGDVTLEHGQEEKILVRFVTKGVATGSKPVEARWKMQAEESVTGLDVKLVGARASSDEDRDPFADDGSATMNGNVAAELLDVQTVRMLQSGKYVAL
ncbi:hypothetical protein YB2330_004383 [Saitoella coloradoensis]